MTTICPHCAAPAAFSAEPLSSSGHMMRCARCGTSWLGRFNPEDPYRRPPMLRQGRPRFEKIIEHDTGFAGRSGSGTPIKAVSRRGLATWSGVGLAIVLAALVTATLFNATGVDAAPESGGKFAGLEVRMIDKPERLRSGKAIAVTGEIVNRSDAALDVPAVRLAFKAKGTELYGWTVEPATMRLAAGDSIRFRSALALSPRGIDEVAFWLADRREITIGTR